MHTESELHTEISLTETSIEHSPNGIRISGVINSFATSNRYTNRYIDNMSPFTYLSNCNLTDEVFSVLFTSDSTLVLAPEVPEKHKCIRSVYRRGGLWGDQISSLLLKLIETNGDSFSGNIDDAENLVLPKLQMSIDSASFNCRGIDDDNYSVSCVLSGTGPSLFENNKISVNVNIFFNKFTNKPTHGELRAVTDSVASMSVPGTMGNYLVELISSSLYQITFSYASN
jgi:hypothetical protein